MKLRKLTKSFVWVVRDDNTDDILHKEDGSFFEDERAANEIVKQLGPKRYTAICLKIGGS